MNKVTMCVMWIVSAIVAIAGMLITKEIEAIYIMAIPLAATYFNCLF